MSPCVFNFYAEYIMRNASLAESQGGIKIAARNINNFRHADDTTLMAESDKEKPAQHIHLPLGGRTAPGKARSGRCFLGTNGATLSRWDLPAIISATNTVISFSVAPKAIPSHHLSGVGAAGPAGGQTGMGTPA